ncbi:endonuclease [Corallincola spongiicola]|uniref:Deoxyribonuclease I n=1 Tax=Corallincola spongiicola TaxID=2520508 RepID=A0ABY1WMN0_9GAMM|nr:endonuclease [Corallincola spongiicola]TAA43678.1 deoxyribonuclease I [Corallincola spongiicola]
MLYRVLFFALFSLFLSVQALADEYSFSQAKRQLKSLYAGQLEPTSFYCGCRFQTQGKKLIPDLTSCGYQVRKEKKRASRIEWEHIVPAWEYGHQKQCWQNGGRKNCGKRSTAFKAFEGDMHNLVPAIGEVNGNRSNFRFGVVTSSKYGSYGQCPMKVDFKQRVAEPPQRARGWIARIYFYMADKHGVKLSSKQRKLFQAWDKQFPPTDSECQHQQAVAALQGDINRYTADKC